MTSPIDFQGVFFWGFLVLFGIVMVLVSPSAKDEGGFFRGTAATGPKYHLATHPNRRSVYSC